ncbi:MAG: Yip1 family protein [bacterium]
MEKVIARVKSILLSPKEALTEVKTEDLSIAGTMKEYVAIVAAVPAVGQFIGYALVGLPFIGRQNIGRTLVYSILTYVLSLIAVLIVGKIINALAPSFNAVKNDRNAFKLTVYSFTPVFVAGAFNIIPSLSILAFLGSLYGIYILYLGIPVLMEAPQEKSVVYTVVTLIIGLIVMVVIGSVAGAVAWSGGGGPARYF